MGSTTSDRNEELVQDFFRQRWNEGDVPTDMVDSDYTVHRQTGTTWSFDEFQAAIDGLREAFPDMRMEIKDVIATDTKVVVRHVWSGTQEAKFTHEGITIPQTGNHAEMAGIAIFRVADERITEAWYVEDTMALVRDLGALPD